VIPLHAGPLTVRYDPNAGDLRYVRWGGEEVIRRVYGAVRDETWDTVPGVLTEIERTVGEDRFRIVYESRHTRGPIDFRWRATLTGDPDGTLTFDFDGEALTAFRRNRIGLCVLHPADVAGRACRVRHTNGAEEAGAFPDLIAPHQPFFDIAAVSHEVAPGVTATIEFAGEVFEMEDQRNWLDASFKTYSTPLALPYPVEVPAGTRVRQTVTLRVTGEAAQSPPPEGNGPIVVTVAEEVVDEDVPRYGLSLTPGQALSSRALRALKALRPDYLRIDTDGADWATAEAAIERSQKIVNFVFGERPVLHLGVRNATALPENWSASVYEAGIEDFLFPPETFGSETDRDEDFEKAGLDIYSAVNAGMVPNFAELNRAAPIAKVYDGVGWAVNPQVHAFDDASIMETPPIITAAIQTSGAWREESTMQYIGPATLYGPYKPDDPRQKTLFGAAWYLSLLCYAAPLLINIDSVTLCEIAGPRGVMSESGDLYPVYHALRRWQALGSETDGMYVVSVSDTRRVAAAGFAVGDGAVAAVLVNLTPEVQQVALPDLSVRGARTAILDEAAATTGWPRLKKVQSVDPEVLTVELPPYAIAEVRGKRRGT
jgi:hypothetical protein